MPLDTTPYYEPSIDSEPTPKIVVCTKCLRALREVELEPHYLDRIPASAEQPCPCGNTE